MEHRKRIGAAKERSMAADKKDASHQVRFWHIADVPLALTNVCLWGKRGHRADIPPCRLMTQSGHWHHGRVSGVCAPQNSLLAQLRSSRRWLRSAELLQSSSERSTGDFDKPTIKAGPFRGLDRSNRQPTARRRTARRSHWRYVGRKGRSSRKLWQAKTLGSP
jgi:hypothetical protein